VLISFTGITQNLIPNPGFEESHDARVTEWIQPQGSYYHYTTQLFVQNGVPSKISFNGLHIGTSYRGTEYMYVALKEPLKAGVTYCARMKVKMPSLNRSEAQVIEMLGWKWIDYTPEIASRTVYRDEPEIKFSITNIPEIYTDFVELNATYTALGGEQLFMVGKYFFEGNNELVLAGSLLNEVSKEYDLVRKYYADSFALISPPIPEYITIKSKRKLNKIMREYQKKIDVLRAPQQQISDSLYAVYQPKIDSLTRLVKSSVREVDVMTYFDDFCLASTRIDGTCNCDGKVAQKDAFVKGETYRLNGVNFETDKYDLDEAAKRELDVLVSILQRYSNYNVLIKGHTDNRALPAHNQQLSENRSKACRDYLVERGIAVQRIKWLGFGATQPVASNDNEEGRAMNRRVEFVLE
jgi:outer membrane protein OmpA-like peptidoglycan-associated protein